MGTRLPAGVVLGRHRQGHTDDAEAVSVAASDMARARWRSGAGLQIRVDGLARRLAALPAITPEQRRQLEAALPPVEAE